MPSYLYADNSPIRFTDGTGCDSEDPNEEEPFFTLNDAAGVLSFLGLGLAAAACLVTGRIGWAVLLGLGGAAVSGAGLAITEYQHEQDQMDDGTYAVLKTVGILGVVTGGGGAVLEVVLPGSTAIDFVGAVGYCASIPAAGISMGQMVADRLR